MVLCGGPPKSVQRKIVILGDGACGKTSLLNVFTRGYFPHVYEPTVFENYIHDIFIDGQQVQLSLWDTAGQEEFDKLRSLSYNDTDCVILCFSVDTRDSLENVKNKWVGEVLEHCEGVKMVLVALKADLRQSEEEESANSQVQQFGTSAYNSDGQLKKLVTYEQGLAVAKQIGAVRYLECSAMKKRGVNEVFTEAARIAIASKPKNAAQEESSSHDCIIL
ncbi:Rho GTPase [Brettanomyces nanus]|uniref:GTP-binding protein RHO3 n=1 Tax=Eeniella nana TaxID=13502 RepID=A0A875S3X0_EENNA|nr:Rho GTPase [Brettanomyces nanus]QPG75648.1 Rho GTPase [Brettanomyces nanus]